VHDSSTRVIYCNSRVLSFFFFFFFIRCSCTCVYSISNPRAANLGVVLPLGTHTVAFLDVQPLEAIATYLAVRPEGNLAHTQPLLSPYVQSLQALPADEPSHVVEMSCSVLEAVLAPWTVQRGESVFDVCVKMHCVGPSSYQIRISLSHDFLFYVYICMYRYIIFSGIGPWP
jgi:hypothetical protein